PEQLDHVHADLGFGRDEAAECLADRRVPDRFLARARHERRARLVERDECVEIAGIEMSFEERVAFLWSPCGHGVRLTEAQSVGHPPRIRESAAARATKVAARRSRDQGRSSLSRRERCATPRMVARGAPLFPLTRRRYGSCSPDGHSQYKIRE